MKSYQMASLISTLLVAMLFGGAGAASALSTFEFLGFFWVFIVSWLIISILLCVWVYKDAKARGENGALWLIIILIAGIIGLIIWLLVRPKK